MPCSKPSVAEPLTVSPKEAERLLGVSHTTLYELIRAGRIDTFRVRRRRMVNYASLKRFAAGGAA